MTHTLEEKWPMKVIKRIFIAFCVIFILHLIPVSYVAWLVANYSEAGTAWLLLLLLDFPLSWSIFPLVSVIPIDSNQYDVWNIQLALALFFQFIGSINWLLVYLLVCCLFKALKRFFVLWFTPME
jgi:hypothetical protein